MQDRRRAVAAATAASAIVAAGVMVAVGAADVAATADRPTADPAIVAPDALDVPDPAGTPREDTRGAWVLGTSAPVGADAADPVDERATQVVVQVEDDGALASVAEVLDGEGVTITDTWDGALEGLTAELTPAEVDQVRDLDGVLAVEENTVLEASSVHSVQEDPVWNLDRIDQRTLPLDSAYAHDADGTGVVAYVIDSGVLATHAELVGRVQPGAYWDFDDGHGPNDCSGHGTHVAGTLAGTTYGVAKAAEVVPVKVLDCAGLSTASILMAGVNWIVEHHQAGQPAVANLSLGGPASDAVDDAVRALLADGIAVVVAAGNDGQDACDYSPARVPDAVTVGATGRADDIAAFSNRGACTDLFAPGVDVRSAGTASDVDTAVASGTSMSSPHAAGAAALILGSAPVATPSEVAGLLVSTGSTGAITGRAADDPDVLLHATTVPAAPSPPTVRAGEGDGEVTVEWVAPDANGSPIVGYRVLEAGGATCTTAGELTCTVTGLPNDSTTTVTVTAENAVGAGAPSPPSEPVMPGVGPTAPVPPTPPPGVGEFECRGRPATIVGTPQGETLRGTPGDDVIVARGGDDKVIALGGRDTICLGAGDDRAFAGTGADVVAGGTGSDLVEGGRGNDRVQGGDDHDVLRGRRGHDVLDGGAGRDTLIGGLGRDRCAGGTGREVRIACDVVTSR